MEPLKDFTRQSYTTQDAVGVYSSYNKIQAPESRILEILKPRLASMSVLDIGIGAGRTTAMLANQVKSYIGIDYSQAMVDAAKRRFAHFSPEVDLRWGDAVCLSSYKENMFDFVIFSYNGIDCLPASSRQKALDEMFRVLKPGGILLFSSHNCLNIPKLLRFRLHRHPRVILRRIFRFFKVRWTNRHALRRRHDDMVTLCDGDLDFRVEYVYVRPSAQVRNLLSMGLLSVRCFALSDGREIPHDELEHETGAWVYYLCEK